MFKEFYKAQIGPQAQGVAPAWPAPQAQVGVEAVAEAGPTPDYLPMEARKSFTDFCAENPVIVAAYQESKLIKGMIDALGYVFHQFEESVSDALTTHANNTDDFVKSFGEALDALQKFVVKGNEKIDQIQKSVQANNGYLVKSQSGGLSYVKSPYDETAVGHYDAISIIENLIKEGKASERDMMKFETTGEVTNEHIRKSLGLGG